MHEETVKLLTVFATVLIIVGLFAVIGAFAFRDFPTLALGIAATGIGITLMSIAAANRSEIREECAVVGTNAEDATYVCVEVTK